MNVTEFKKRYRFAKSFHIYPGRNGAVFDMHDLEFIKLCFVFRLCWIGRVREQAKGLLKYYDGVWPVIGSHVTAYRDGKKRKNPGKAKADTGEVLRSWLSDPENAPKMMIVMTLFNKRYDDEGADIRLDFMGMDMFGGGYIDLYLPAAWVEAEPLRYSKWCAELAGSFEFCSGLAGFGLSLGAMEVSGGYAAREELYALGKHHPGLDVHSAFSRHMGQGIKGVNWLTFLHPNFVNRLGGRQVLGAALDQPGIVVTDLPSGVMIQAGPAPVIGDTNAQIECPYYHQVGRVLAPIRDRDYPQLMTNSTDAIADSSERTEEWLSRFDD